MGSHLSRAGQDLAGQRSLSLAIMQSFADSMLATRTLCRRKRVSVSTTRSLSSTAATHTRLRQTMFRWLDGPGKTFRASATDGPPQYLGSQVPQHRVARHDKKPSEEATTEVGEKDEDESTPSRGRKNASSRPSNPMSMIPFPTNLRFKSDPVLSEELKDYIWHRVMVDKVSVRRVSAELHVEMRRVGAVVRLKGLEKEWEAEVCVHQ